MSLTFKEEILKSTYEKITLGGLIFFIAFLASNFQEQGKIIQLEKLKNVPNVVASTGRYIGLIDEYSYFLDQLDVEQLKYHIHLTFNKEDDEKRKNTIVDLMKKKEKKLNDLYKKLKTSDFFIGPELQNHLLMYLSNLNILYEAKESSRQGTRNGYKWQVENSYTLIEEMNKKLHKMRLTSLGTRNYAIEKAIL